jgi:AcrR family transcriptional regulator
MIMQSAAATTRAQQAQQTRALLIATSRRMFAERGYDATSLQALADEVGLTKAAVYYHFKTKAELLQAGAEPAFAAISALLEQAATRRNRAERIEVVVDGLLDVVIPDRQMLAVMNRDPAARRDKVSHDAADELVKRGQAILYGPHPTPAEQAAYRFAVRLPEVVADLADFSDAELRATLRPLCIRILSTRG